MPDRETRLLVVQDGREAADSRNAAHPMRSERSGARNPSPSEQLSTGRCIAELVHCKFDALANLKDQDDVGSVAVSTSICQDAPTPSDEQVTSRPASSTTGAAVALDDVKYKAGMYIRTGSGISAQASLGAVSGPLSGASSSASAWGSPSPRGRLRQRGADRARLEALLERSLAGEAGLSQGGGPAVVQAVPEEWHPWGEQDRLRQQGATHLRTDHLTKRSLAAGGGPCQDSRQGGAVCLAEEDEHWVGDEEGEGAGAHAAHVQPENIPQLAPIILPGKGKKRSLVDVHPSVAACMRSSHSWCCTHHASCLRSCPM